MRRFFILLLLVLITTPGVVQISVYPPDGEPLTPPEVAFRALGFFFEDEAPPDIAVGDPVEITVLVAVASGVSCNLGIQGTDRTNLTTTNSAQGHIRFRWVGCVVTGYVSSGSAVTDLNRLQLQSDGFMDSVHSERNRLYADLVVLIGKSVDSCGLAFLLAGPTSAFAYVADICISNSSFEHELGHLFGMNHDRPNTSNTSGFAFGFCIKSGSWKDVLTYPNPCGGIRVPHYSNPDVLYQGFPTGTPTENNARQLREQAPRVSGFRIPPSKPIPATVPTVHLR